MNDNNILLSNDNDAELSPVITAEDDAELNSSVSNASALSYFSSASALHDDMKEASNNTTSSKSSHFSTTTPEVQKEAVSKLSVFVDNTNLQIPTNGC